MKDCYGLDPVDAAVYESTHDYKDSVTGQRGVAALAVRMDANEGTLQNKINPACGTHELTLKEFRKILLHTNDMRPLHALCAEFKHVAMPLMTSDDVSDAALLELLTEVDIEKAEFLKELQRVLADGQVYRAEYERLSAECMDWVRAILKTLDRLQGMVVPVRPTTMREVK